MDAATLLHPASQQGQEILDLLYMLLGVAAFIFAVVSSLVVYSSIRFRRREGDAEPKPVAENRKLEIIWTVIPGLIVTWRFVTTVYREK
jgi:cytochrome c oxidase subunit 2